MKILVADDEEPCRRLLQDIFIDVSDIELTLTEDGAEAWWHLSDPTRRFDLGIFDFRMPKVDGLALIERIRSHALLRHLPVILCTGVSDRDTVARAARLAISQYVVKPFKPDAMREKIRKFTPRHGGPEQTLIVG